MTKFIFGIIQASFLLLSVTVYADDSTDIKISLIKSANSEWRVSYQLPKAVKQLVFLRSPNDARVKRWISESPNLELVFEDNYEVVRHQFGESFTVATFKLTPNYVHLPKDYAPFMQFSNGGIAIYTGRYFVCLETCETDTNKWSFNLTAADTDTIISNGNLSVGSASWVDKDSGQNVYVGAQKPLESSHFFGIIDPILPKEIVKPLNKSLPELMDFFAEKLGLVDDKPLVFASFEKKDKTVKPGSQGGTLPNQVFMFWYGGDIKERATQNNFLEGLLWFFGHEAAHFYQKGNFDNKHAWIHEGSAELMAYLALNEIMPKTRDYTEKKLNFADAMCKKKREKISLDKASETGEFKMHYNCGLVLLKQLHEDILSKHPDSDGIYLIWRNYLSAISNGEIANDKSFLIQVAKLVGDDKTRQMSGYLTALENQQ